MRTIICHYCKTQSPGGGDNLDEIIPACGHLLTAKEDISDLMGLDRRNEIERKILRWEEGIKEDIDFEEMLLPYVYIYSEDDFLGEVITLYRDLVGEIFEGYIVNYLPQNKFKSFKRYILSEIVSSEEGEMENAESVPSFSVSRQIYYFFEDYDRTKKDIKDHFDLISAIEIPIPVNVIIKMRQLIKEVVETVKERRPLDEGYIDNMIETLNLLYPEFSIENIQDMLPKAHYIKELWKLKKIDNSLYLLTKDVYGKYKRIKNELLPQKAGDSSLTVFRFPSQDLLTVLSNDAENALTTMRKISENCVELIIEKYNVSIPPDNIEFGVKVREIFNTLKRRNIISNVESTIMRQDIIYIYKKCSLGAHGSRAQGWRSVSERINVLREILRLWTMEVTPGFMKIFENIGA